MFEATPQRKKLVVVILLLLAGIGGVIRLTAPNPSSLRDIGSLLLVLWVPVIGNVVGYFFRRIKLGRARGFDSRPFSGELQVALTPLPDEATPAPAAHDALHAFVVGTEGFSVRLSQPLAWPGEARETILDAQFLRPELALSSFSEDTAFRVLAGHQLVAQGRVVRVLRSATA